MGLTLARVVVSVLLFCAPFLVFVLLSADPANGLILIVPFFGAIPAILGALILFVPAEMLLDRLGVPWLKNIVVPLLGASLIAIFMIVMGSWQGELSLYAERLLQDPAMFVSVMAVWIVFGALWGVAWRCTEWLARRIGWVRS